MPIRVYYEVLNQKGTPALYSDNYAQRPAAGYVGRIFYSPDTAQIFYDTGTTWTLLADAGVGSGSLASVCANGNTTATGISITAGGLSTNSITNTSNTAGSILFAGTGGAESQSNATFFWDNTNKRLGIGNNAPGVALDIHGTGTLVQLNGTGANNSFLQFQNAGTSKWRVGNLYNAGANTFQIYNNTTAGYSMQIDNANATTFIGSVTSNSFISAASGITLTNGGTTTTAGATNIGGLTAGLSIALASGFNQTLTFPTGVAYTYTYPSATGTLINATSFTSNTLPKYSGTAGVLTASMLSDDGTSVTSAGATRSNLYIKAVNNTYYGQLAFTNGSNGSFGGISYNNSGQYMQIETNSSEWIRITGAGNVGFNTTNVTEGTQAAGSLSIFPVSSVSGGPLIQFAGNGRIRPASGGDRFSIDGNSLYLNSYIGGNIITNTAGGQFFIATSSAIQSTETLAVVNSTNAAIFGKQTGGASAWVQKMWNDATTGDNRFVEFLTETVLNSRGSINYNRAAGLTSFNTTSDYRLKTEISDFDALEIISNLKPKKFKMIDASTKMIGFIAHELKEFYPQAVIGEKDEIDSEGKEIYQVVDYSQLTGLLTKGIQQLNDRVTALEQNLN